MRNGSKKFRGLTLFTLCFFSWSNVALANYTPGELNPLLGRPVLMDASTCIRQYGMDFCACVELESGGSGCYYRKPPAGYYSLQRCEEIWGNGYCVCSTDGMCRLRDDASQGNAVGCAGQIYLFPGSSSDCRKAGLHTMWNNCCLSADANGGSCSFENLAKTLGWDDVAIGLAQMAGSYLAKKELANMAGTMAVEYALKNGAFDFATSAIGSVFGAGAPSIAQQGGQMVIQYGAETFATQSAELAAQYIAGAFMAAFSFVTWAYTIYQMYNMVDALTQCTGAEKIYACKKAKGNCHTVGTRCTLKIFGACLQEKEVSCCFDSVLARIIHEQGRSQLGMAWGSAKSPSCRGFFVDEFVRIDFTRIDFGEYTDDLTRQMLNDGQLEKKITNTVQKYARDMGEIN